MRKRSAKQIHSERVVRIGNLKNLSRRLIPEIRRIRRVQAMGLELQLADVVKKVCTLREEEMAALNYSPVRLTRLRLHEPSDIMALSQ